MTSLLTWTEIEDYIQQNLTPLVTAIDQHAYYPADFLKELGKKGAYQVTGKTSEEIDTQFLRLIEEAGKVCGTTAFTIWCQAAAILYARNGESNYIKENLLPLLESGDVLGGTGLSNPMKYYAGMEDVRLKAVQEEKGYRIKGVLPFVSNLGPGHWFGIIAQVSEEQRIMALLPSDLLGLSLTEVTNFIGINGSGTYKCCFNDVLIPKEYILSEDADQWIPTIRPQFVLYQIGIALGIIESSITSIKHLKNKQKGINHYIHPSIEELEERTSSARKLAFQLAENPIRDTQDIMNLRLGGAYLSVDTTNIAMLHNGAAGYLEQSNAFRRLREAHFVASVTPAIKQLEKVLEKGWGDH